VGCCVAARSTTEQPATTALYSSASGPTMRPVLILRTQRRCPIAFFVDEVDQLAQATMITTIESKAQARQRLQFRLIQFHFTAGLLFEAALQIKIGELPVHVIERGICQHMIHTHDEATFHPAA